MELIERYVYEVARQLPQKMRDDVRAELRSLLTDALEERAAAAGRADDDELAAQVLQEFGKPDAVALRYRPAQWLIGPELFPAFLSTARIVMLVLAALVGWLVLMGLVFDPARMPEFFRWEGITSFFWRFGRLAFYNLALLVLVFAVLERLKRRRSGSSPAEEWDPRKLPEVSDPDRAKVGDLVFSTYAIVILFVVFNFYPEWFGLVFFTGEGMMAISFVEMGLTIPVLLMNAWWVGAMALNVAVLKRGGWTAEARWAEFGLGLFGAVILFLVLTGSTISAESMEELASRGLTGSAEMITAARRGLPWIGRLFHVVLTGFLLITLVHSGVRLYRLFTRYRGLRALGF